MLGVKHMNFDSDELCLCGHHPLDHSVSRGWYHTGLKGVVERVLAMGVKNLIYPCKECRCHTYEGSGVLSPLIQHLIWGPYDRYIEPEPEEIDISSV